MALDTNRIQELSESAERGEYDKVIAGVRDLVTADRRSLTDPWVKQWCGRRWRNLFLSEAVLDDVAVKEATGTLGLLDKRDTRQKIAERFLKGDARTEWNVEMPDWDTVDIVHTTLVFAPGLINGLLPVRAFTDEFGALTTGRGWKIMRADGHPVRGCEANMADYMATLETGAGLNIDGSVIDEATATPPEDVIFVGYSKGSPDVLTFLAHHPEVAPRVKGVFTWAGAVGGSYLADGAYDTVKDLDLGIVGGTLSSTAKMLLTLFAPFLNLDEGSLRRLDEYDVKTAIRDLTTGHRVEFMQLHAKTLDALDVPFFSVTGATSMLEVPTFQMQGYLQLAKYDSNNDMQVTQEGATVNIPMGTHLAMLHGHHWEMSYGKFPLAIRAMSPNLDHAFPRQAAIAAIVEFSAELGLIA